jgi:hypothetical protein
VVLLDVHAREQLVEVGGDDLLERHVALAVGQDHEPGQQVGDLDPGEAAHGGVGVAHDDGQVERQVRDVGERVPGVDRQGGEHREDALLEELDEELLVVLVEVGPRRQLDAGVGQPGGDPLQERGLEPGQQQLEPVADLEQLLRGGQPVGAVPAHAGRHLVLEGGHPDLEELVEVLAEDGQELGPLQQRHPVVVGQRQHALVEVEPGQLAVAVPHRRLRAVAHEIPYVVMGGGHAERVPAHGARAPLGEVNVG